ncbi:PAS-domain containing protein [Sphingobium sufflavum]|uniref:sensor histidine kinase n=1 Tax=Sphingobium sufflavum TaxID=1129547 RepID=UPI001F37C5B2|nr:PAS domain-containing sensor histidine kinase [Sphingobium sufflavum]MCE7797050.1 PAS-domain containing protein [Sphingobium sufflavum]
MIVLTPIALALAGALLALWLIVSVWAVRSGLVMRMQARSTDKQVEAMADLLQSAPAIAVIVRADGRIEAPDRLAAWLGRDSVPAFISELTAADGGLEPEHAALLGEELAASQKGSRSFALPVKALGSDRSLLVRAVPFAPGNSAPGATVLWIFDATESQSQIDSLRGEVGRYRDALEALSGVIEAAPMPIWFRGLDRRLQLVNTHYVRAVNADGAEQVIGQNIELVEPFDGQSAADAAAAAAIHGKAVERMLPVTIGTSRRMMRVVDVPLGAQGVATYALDMHELEDARLELRHLAQAQRDMFDRMSAGMAQFGSDQRLKFCNQPFTSIFALTPDQVAHDSDFDRVLDAMRDSGNLPEMRDFPAWRSERRQWFQSQTPQEDNWLLRDGIHIRVVAQPLPDGGLLLVFEDRTEQVQLSSARDTLLRVRTATFDNLFEAIGVFAADGRLHLWNSRFRSLWGVEEKTLAEHPRIDELMATVADRLAKPQQASLVRQLIRAATNERRQRVGRIAFADGRYFEFAAIPLPDGNALFAMLDITDSRRIERALRDRNEALEEADRVKTAFVSNMSYELRTPLTSIAGFSEMMIAGYAGTLSDMSREYIEAIMASTERLTHLIDNVLDLTQGAAGALPIERKSMNVEEIAREAGGHHEEAARSASITLVYDIRPGAGVMEADSRRICQAIDHLLDNAVRYTGTGGRILLHADGDEQGVRIIVSDDGPGMDEKTQGRLFDVFARFSQDRQVETDGVGLLLVKRLVESHGGTVSLLSEPGQGTIVTLDMPRS